MTRKLLCGACATLIAKNGGTFIWEVNNRGMYYGRGMTLGFDFHNSWMYWMTYTYDPVKAENLTPAIGAPDAPGIPKYFGPQFTQFTSSTNDLCVAAFPGPYQTNSQQTASKFLQRSTRAIANGRGGARQRGR